MCARSRCTIGSLRPRCFYYKKCSAARLYWLKMKNLGGCHGEAHRAAQKDWGPIPGALFDILPRSYRGRKDSRSPHSKVAVKDLRSGEMNVCLTLVQCRLSAGDRALGCRALPKLLRGTCSSVALARTSRAVLPRKPATSSTAIPCLSVSLRKNRSASDHGSPERFDIG